MTPLPREDLRVALVVDPSLGTGLLGNTLATVAIGLGAAVPELGGARLTDRTGLEFVPSASVPVPVLKAGRPLLGELLLRAVQDDPPCGVVVAFPGFARRVHDFADYREEVTRRDLREEDVHGLGLAGPRRWVSSLTGSLPLLR